MDYKTMSIEEISREYDRWTPDPKAAVPVQNMYHGQQMKILNELTADQRQAFADHSLSQYERTVSEGKIFAYGAAGLFFLFIAWALLAS